MIDIILATNNKYKVEEFKRILMPFNFNMITLKQLGCNSEIEETGTSFEENAFIKASNICKKYKKPTISDDSGLSIDTLGGFPGIYSAKFNYTQTTICLQKSEKILEIMKNIPQIKRSAKFVSAICFIISLNSNNSTFENAQQSDKVIFTRGECTGTISCKREGSNGFDYDSIFTIGNKTFAQLTPSQKDAVSHRGKALRNFVEQLNLIKKNHFNEEILSL